MKAIIKEYGEKLYKHRRDIVKTMGISNPLLDRVQADMIAGQERLLDMLKHTPDHNKELEQEAVNAANQAESKHRQAKPLH